MRRSLGFAAGVAALLLAFALWVPSQASGPPVFVIEDRVEIDATPDAVWATFVDFEALPEWNPYLLSLVGDPTPGGEIEIVIVQDDWSRPMTLKETVVSREEGRFFHWHGSLFLRGLLETDHSFAIEPIGRGRSRFIHREEFRGVIARWLDPASREATLRAFRAMDAALARRAAARDAPEP